jgi:hypothetical protein
MTGLAALLVEVPSIGTAGAIGGLLIFVVAAAIAFVVFRILRKSLRIAFRLALVVAILVIAAVGAGSLWWFGTDDGPNKKPASERRR